MRNKKNNTLDIIFHTSNIYLYEVTEDNIVTILIKQDHIIQRFFRKLGVKIPDYQRIKLDEVGSFIFLQIDGHRTVREIGESLEQTFGGKVHPLYDRLSLFLYYMQKRYHFIDEVKS